MNRRWASIATVVLGALLVVPAAASAFDPRETFHQGAFVLSAEGGVGEDGTVERHRVRTQMQFWNAGVRFSLLPFGVTGSGPLFGALEVGLEPFYQRYASGLDAFYAGLAAVGRYHFLSLGRFVPYVELAGSAGATDLKIREIDSGHAFLLFAGAGASFFVTDRSALYAGYRFQHVSNGNTDEPNRGFESNTAVLGISVFFK